MSEAAPCHLDHAEVELLLKKLETVEAVVVGGQALALWCRLFLDQAPHIASAYSLTSEDLDVYGSAKEAATFAALLDDAELIVTPAWDASPNSAVVIGKINDRTVRVDFMRNILGVSPKSIKDHYVTFERTMEGGGEPVRFSLLHPLDCLRSRLSNINDLKRQGVHAITSAVAAMTVVDLFISELLDAGEFRKAQHALLDLFYIGRDNCLDKPAGKLHSLNPLEILQKYRLDVRLDERWRGFQLTGAINRYRKKMKQREKKQNTL
jgi:hypothetical protein